MRTRTRNCGVFTTSSTSATERATTRNKVSAAPITASTSRLEGSGTDSDPPAASISTSFLRQLLSRKVFRSTGPVRAFRGKKENRENTSRKRFCGRHGQWDRQAHAERADGPF